MIWLLWKGHLPKQAELDSLKALLFSNYGLPPAAVGFLKANLKGAPMDVLRTAVSMLSLDNPAEAAKSFDEAIKLGDVRGGAYREALEGKKKLSQP